MIRWIAAAGLIVVGIGAPAQQPVAPYANRAEEPHSKDPAVAKAEAEAAKLDKQLKAKPKDAALKMKTAEAYFKAGHTLEYSDKLSPRTRYRGALKLYKRTLELNPKHAEAAKEKKQIEDIYKQMGMPVPK